MSRSLLSSFLMSHESVVLVSGEGSEGDLFHLASKKKRIVFVFTRQDTGLGCSVHFGCQGIHKRPRTLRLGVPEITTSYIQEPSGANQT